MASFFVIHLATKLNDVLECDFQHYIGTLVVLLFVFSRHSLGLFLFSILVTHCLNCAKGGGEAQQWGVNKTGSDWCRE